MAELSYRDAVAYAIAQEMRRDPTLVMLGEDIAAAGGVFKTTVGLLDEFGPDRVRDTPLSELAFVGGTTVGSRTSDAIALALRVEGEHQEAPLGQLGQAVDVGRHDVLHRGRQLVQRCTGRDRPAQRHGGIPRNGAGVRRGRDRSDPVAPQYIAPFPQQPCCAIPAFASR